MEALVEREKELKAFHDRLDAQHQGRGGVVLVSGEAGVGKSSLLEAIRAIALEDMDVQWTMCDPLFNPRPLSPLYDLTGHFAGIVRELANDQQEQTDVFHHVFDCLSNSKKPVLLVLEDAHWADNATIDFIKFMARRVAFTSCTFCLSFRSDEVSPTHPLHSALEVLPAAHTLRLPLSPLSEQGVAVLAHRAGQPERNLHQITQGNPFFVTELLANQTDADDALPLSVQEAVNARLNRLVENERAFLEQLSFVATGLSTELVSALYPEQGDTLAMACVARGLLIIDTAQEFRFRHELARLATLSRVPQHKHIECHLKVLLALQNLADPDLGALVFHAAEAMQADAVLAYAQSAAAAASQQGAHKEAALYLETALKFVDEADTEVAAQLYEDWAYESGLSQIINDEVIEARKLAITLWRALKRDDKVGENLRWLSRLHWYRGEAALANRYADDAITVLESCPPSSERAMAYSLRSQLDMLNERMDEAIAWGNKALELEAQQPNMEVRVHALNNIGSARAMRGDQQGKVDLLQSLELALEHDLHEHAARAYTNLSDYCLRYRDLQFGETIINQGIAFDTKHELDSWTYYLVGIQAQLRFEQGRLSDAKAIAEGVIDLSNQTKLMKLPARIVLARTQLRLGEPDFADNLQMALSVAINIGEPQYIIPLYFCQWEAAFLQQDERQIDMCLEGLSRFSINDFDHWRAGELALWCARTQRNLPFDFELELPELIQAELSAQTDIVDRWVKAGMPINAALALSGLPTITQKTFDKVIDILRLCNADAYLDFMQQLADKHGLDAQNVSKRRGPYQATRQHPLGLTAKEQQVLGLLLQGLSNQAIAEKLSRSRRTVENHVSSILSKLDATTRMDAILRVQAEPWLAPTQ